MAYDNDFYNAYKSYLAEKTVRRAHDRVFEIAMLDANMQSVVDFGCGMFNEFYVYARPKTYIGVDINVETSLKGNKRLVKADYRSCESLNKLVTPDSPTSFTSLFSTEITAPAKQNYKFYEMVFEHIPSIQSGLVSGFYYVSKKGKNPIGEAGGLTSYQTLEEIESVRSDVFDESRIVMHVPSKMFGQDVYEVWKLFARRKVI